MIDEEEKIEVKIDVATVPLDMLKLLSIALYEEYSRVIENEK